MCMWSALQVSWGVPAHFCFCLRFVTPAPPTSLEIYHHLMRIRGTTYPGSPQVGGVVWSVPGVRPPPRMRTTWLNMMSDVHVGGGGGLQVSWGVSASGEVFLQNLSPDVSADFTFVSPGGGGEDPLPPWLTAHPSAGTVLPGDTLRMVLTASVDGNVRGWV
jgi:hypothetical protein